WCVRERRCQQRVRVRHRVDTVPPPAGWHRWRGHTARLVESRAVEKGQETLMGGVGGEEFEVLAPAIGTGLRREGMAVDVVLDGNDALEHLAVTRYDVVVLDRDLPGVHGDEVCRKVVAGGAGG